MKKITKLLVVSAVLTMLFAMPVMAKEVSFSSENTDYLITLLNANTAKLNGDLANFIKVQCGPGADAIIANQTALVNSKIAAVNKECAENHIAFLNQKIYNLKHGIPEANVNRPFAIDGLTTDRIASHSLALCSVPGMTPDPSHKKVPIIRPLTGTLLSPASRIKDPSDCATA